MRKLSVTTALVAATASLMGFTAVVGAGAAHAGGSPASFTSVDESEDGTGNCLNASPVNCNLYAGKQYVWMNGGPVGTVMGDGDYFFAVLSPSGQSDPNDGSTQNLSDGAHGDYTDRMFTVSGGVVTYFGNHDQDGNKIRLMPYDDTTNHGGVYILAICSLADGYPVVSSSCKYDAFRAPTSTPPPPGGVLDAPSAVKDATGAYTEAWTWDVQKSVAQSSYWQADGTVSPYYTVAVTHDSGTISNVTVSGTISVFNSNIDASNNTVPITHVTVSDKLSDGTTCAVTDGSDVTLSAFETDFPYTCSLSGLPQSQLDNSVYLTYPAQTANGSLDASDGSVPVYTFQNVQFTNVTDVDDSVTVTDAFNGGSPDSLGVVSASDPSPTYFHPARTIPVVADTCITYNNTAATTTDTTQTPDSSSASVSVCGGNAGGHTIGFWQNKNGQSVIAAAGSTAGVCNVTSSLRNYNMFKDLPSTASCSQVQAYVTNVIKAASASGAAMNAMLKAQSLATALAVYFSDPLHPGSATYAKYGVVSNLGLHTVDLTHVWGSENTAAAFGGGTCQTVNDLLAYASGQSNVGGSAWYGQVKATQGLAKDTFDAINNQSSYHC